MNDSAIKVLPIFNPLDKKNLAESIADAMLQSEITALPPKPCVGAGVYAIYYIGSFRLYQKIAERNRNDRFTLPIYVGKACPSGTRKGGMGLNAKPGQALYRRLIDHAKSIEEVENLDIKDFYCRFMAVDDIWIPLAESLLIEKFEPLWNRTLDGFGNHAPGAGRNRQQISQWDTVHPGRHWAKNMNGNTMTKEMLMQQTQKFILDHYQ